MHNYVDCLNPLIECCIIYVAIEVSFMFIVEAIEFWLLKLIEVTLVILSFIVDLSTKVDIFHMLRITVLELTSFYLLNRFARKPFLFQMVFPWLQQRLLLATWVRRPSTRRVLLPTCFRPHVQMVESIYGSVFLRRIRIQARWLTSGRSGKWCQLDREPATLK